MTSSFVNCITLLSMLIPILIECRGISRPRDGFFATRALDSPIPDSLPCMIPVFLDRLPPNVKQKIELIWQDYAGDGDCWIELARTRNTLQLLTAKEREELNSSSKKDCKPPEVIEVLPEKIQQRILDIWKDRDTTGDCFQQQRKTRLILLNLPVSLRYMLHPPAFECAVPHFIDRLELDLQGQLRSIWEDYKFGEPCADRIDKQLTLLSEHEISLQSFQMPPPSLFRRYELLRKLKRASRA